MGCRNCCAILLVLYLSVLSENSLGFKIKHNRQNWDFLVFTQQWPAVSCLSWKVLNPSHKCNISDDVNSWTVHGIWPSSYDHSSPSFCNNSLTFNESQIQNIKSELHVHWPNIYANTPEDQLWAHEWNKHGTCAAILPPLKTEELFFNQGIQWSKQYDLLSILAEFGISPSKTTPVLAYDIAAAIKKKLEVEPSLVCDYVPANKTYYIFEIELCFSKTLELMNCPTKTNYNEQAQIGATSCSSNQLVWYPEIEHTGQLGGNQRQLSAFGRLFQTVMTILPYTW